jgi:hypothetical protein
MAPPILTKTWTIGRVVVPAAPTTAELHKRVMWNIKELLVSMGFSISQSVAWNPTGAWEGPSAGDLWVAWDYLKYGAPIATYGCSWAVFDHPVGGLRSMCEG